MLMPVSFTRSDAKEVPFETILLRRLEYSGGESSFIGRHVIASFSEPSLLSIAMKRSNVKKVPKAIDGFQLNKYI